MRRVFQSFNLNIIPWLVLACSLVFTFLLWRAEEHSVMQKAEARFQEKTRKIESAITFRLYDYQLMLQGCIGLFNSSDLIKRHEWKTYVQSIDPHNNYPGIQGIGFARRVIAAEKEAHIRELRAEGFPDYTIRPAGDRVEYFPIIYLEPFIGRNLWAFSFDMFSEPVRRAAMEEARDRGVTTISGKVTLEQETTQDIQPGFLMYVPLYEPNRPLTSVQERRAALRGFVYSPFRMNDFMRGIRTIDHDSGSVVWEVYDGSDGDSNTILYRSIHNAEHSFNGAIPVYEKKASLDLFGKTWTLYFKTMPSFEASMDRTRLFALVCFSIPVSLLLFAVTFLVVDRSKALAAEIIRSERDQNALRESQERFAYAMDAAHEGLWDWNKTTGKAYYSPRWKSMLGYAENEIGDRFDEFLSRLHPDDREYTVDRVNEYLKNNLPRYSTEFRLRHKDGHYVNILSRAFSMRDASGAIVRTVGTHMDITERKAIEQAQLFLLQCGTKEGEDFFESLAAYLAEKLGMDFVCIDKLANDSLSALSLAVYCDGKFENNIEYTLKDTPCGDVVGNQVCSFKSDVRRLFPKDSALRDLQAESYVGTTLWSMRGEPIGLIAVIGRKPLADTSLAETLLKRVGIRAAGELERREAEEKIVKANKAYKALSVSGQALMRARDESEFLQASVRIVHEICGYSLVWLGFAEHDAAKTVSMVAQAGDVDGNLNSVRITWGDDECGWGPTGTAIRTRKPVINHNTLTTPSLAPWRDRQIQHGFLSSAAFPLLAGGEVLGALMVYASTAEAFTDEEIQLLMELSSNLAYSIIFMRMDAERKQAEADLRTSNARLDILAETASNLLKSDEPQLIVDTLCRRLMSFLDCQTFFNFLVDKERHQLHLNAFAGIPQDEAAKIEWLDYGVAVCGCVARDGCRIVAEDIVNTPDIRTELVKSYGIQAYACHPLLSQGEAIGTLAFGTRTRSRFTDDELSLMKAVADQVAIAIEHKYAQEYIAQLNSDLQGKVQELEEEVKRRTFAEKNLMLYADELSRSNEELDSFASALSHDLQEPLRSIAGFIRLLEKKYGDVLNSGGKEYIERSIASSVRLGVMINSLLSYSRITTRAKEFEHHELDAILKTALENLHASISQTRALITSESLPLIYGDRNQLVRVFQNLIGNSIKYCESSRPEINVSWHRSDDTCIIAVADNGPGIEPEHLENIFEVFNRCSSNQTISGAGMGLALCKKIIERHREKIWAESVPGKGSTFFFSLPLQ